MTDLVSCTRCKKTMIDEEYDDHECSMKLHSLVKLKFLSYDIIQQKSKNLITIFDDNGVCYQFQEIPEDKEHTKIPFIRGSTDVRRGENSTSFKTICGDFVPKLAIFLSFADFSLVRL